MINSMKDVDLISVIIPAYNAEKCIVRAVNSVLAQTYSNFELLIIDDGSSDQTANICEKLERNNARIKLIKNKHGGLANSRNTGISFAKGKYIAFLDSDDEYEPEFLSKMLIGITKNDSEICICGYTSIYAKYNEISNCLKNEEYKVYNKKQLTRALLKGEISSHSWNKIYSRRIIDILHYPNDKYYEDVFVMNDLIQKVNSAAVIDYIGVKYYQNNDSIVHRKKDEIEMDAFDAFYERMVLLQAEYSEYEDYILKMPIEIAIRLVTKKLIMGTELEKKQFDKIKLFLKKQKFNKKAYGKLKCKYKLALFLWG